MPVTTFWSLLKYQIYTMHFGQTLILTSHCGLAQCPNEESTLATEQLHLPTKYCEHLVPHKTEYKWPTLHYGCFGLSTSHGGQTFWSWSESSV